MECIVLGDGASRLREQTHVRRFDSNFEHDGSYGIVGSGLFLMQARKHARLSDLIRAGTYVFSLFFPSLFTLLIDYIDLSCALVHKLWETHPLHRHRLHVLIHQHLLILIVSALIITYHRDHLHHHRHHHQLRNRHQLKNTDNNTMPTTQICLDSTRLLLLLQVGYPMEPVPLPDRAAHPNPCLGRWLQVPLAV